MTEKYSQFIQFMGKKSDSVKKLAGYFVSIENYDFAKLSEEDIKNMALDFKCNTRPKLINLLYIAKSYADYLGEQNAVNLITTIDRGKLLNETKTDMPSFYISNKEYKQAYQDIGMFEALNGFYLQTLLRSIYEGIYCGDFSVISNLRASDIKGDIVTLRNDNGDIYDLKISQELANDLIDLSTLEEWYRKNRSTMFSVPLIAEYKDSCFKFVETPRRKTNKVQSSTYYQRLRKITDNYFGRKITPNAIFVSGIMYRLSLIFEEYGLSLSEVFDVRYKKTFATEIIEHELHRCNYNISISAFKGLVNGNIDIFCKDN